MVSLLLNTLRINNISVGIVNIAHHKDVPFLKRDTFYFFKLLVAFIFAHHYKNDHQMIHIGKIIEAELHRQNKSVTWLADMLICDRTNVYSIFKRQSMDTELLLRISRILHYDFFHYYSAQLEGVEVYPCNKVFEVRIV